MAVKQAQWKLTVDAKRCTGCRMCEQACTFFHEGEFNPRRARVKVIVRSREGINAPLVCTQCKTCLDACKRGALTWDEQAGIVRVNAEKCNACALCASACPQGAIMMDPISKTAKICDLCNGDPECAKWCFEKVLKFEQVAEQAAAPEAHFGPKH